MPYLHSIPSSKEPKVDGLLLRNVCIDERASIAVPGNKKNSFYHSFFHTSKNSKLVNCFHVASTIIAYYDVIHFPFLFSLLCRKSVLKVEFLKDQNLKSHLLRLIISYKSSAEKLIKYQANSSCMIICL